MSENLNYKELFEESLAALENIVNGIKDASPYFLYTNSYLRRRKECPGAKKFDEGMRIMNGSLIETIDIYKNLKDAHNEKSVKND